MESFKIKLIYLIIPSLLLFSSCEGRLNNKKMPVVGKDSNIVKKKSKTPVNDNVVPIGNTHPYNEVDSLMGLIKQNYNVASVKKIEQICVNSDGDLSEYIDDVAIKLFNDHLNQFTDYLIDNPNSCLKDKLIEEIGSELSVYSKSERSGKLLEKQETTLALASTQDLSSKKVAIIKKIFSQVNPDLLD